MSKVIRQQVLEAMVYHLYDSITKNVCTKVSAFNFVVHSVLSMMVTKAPIVDGEVPHCRFSQPWPCLSFLQPHILI